MDTLATACPSPHSQESRGVETPVSKWASVERQELVAALLGSSSCSMCPQVSAPTHQRSSSPLTC